MSLSGVVILFIQKFYIVLFVFIPQLMQCDYILCKGCIHEDPL